VSHSGIPQAADPREVGRWNPGKLGGCPGGVIGARAQVPRIPGCHRAGMPGEPTQLNPTPTRLQVASELDGISLGMTPVETRLSKGAPTSEINGGDGRLAYIYRIGGWEDANGSAIWLSSGSDGNEIVGNTFEDIAGSAVVIQGDSNRVVLRSEDDAVRDLGNGNWVSSPGHSTNGGGEFE
jgi:hypothetical protein